MAYRRAKNVTWGRAIANAMASALKTVPGAALLTTPKLSLVSAAPLLTPDVTVAMFTKCIFTGYADQVTVISGPVNLAALLQGMETSVLFQQTGATGDIAVGYLLSDGVNAFYAAEIFIDGQVNFVNSGDFLQLDMGMPVSDSLAIP